MLPSVLKSWRVPTLQVPIKALRDGLQSVSKDNILTHIQRYLTTDLQAGAVPSSQSVSVRPTSDVLKGPEYLYFWEKLKKCFGLGSKKEGKGKKKWGKKTKKQTCKSKSKGGNKKETCSEKKEADKCGAKGAEKPKVDCKPKDSKKSADPCKKDEKKDAKKAESCKKEEKKDSKTDLKKAGACKKDEKKKDDPCKKKDEKKKDDPCKKKEEKKKEDPCKKKDEKIADPSKKKEDKKKEDPCKKKDEKKDDPCKKKDDPGKNKNDPCKKKDEKKDDPCKKKGEEKKDEKKDDPCKKKEEKKDDPCKKKDEKKDDPCKKKEEKKDDPCKKKDEKKDDPCKKKEEKKDDPCKKKDEKKDDPCKKKDDPCKKKDEKKDDPCKKKDEKKDDPCKKKDEKKDDPCKKKEDPCKKKEEKKEEKKEDPCKKKDPCGDKFASNESLASDPILLFSMTQSAHKKTEEFNGSCKDPCAAGACDVLPGQDEPCGSSVSWKVKVKPCGQRRSSSSKTRCSSSSATACIINPEKNKDEKVIKDSGCGLTAHPCGKKLCPNRCEVKKKTKFSSLQESFDLGVLNFINVLAAQAVDILSLAVNFASQRGTPIGQTPPRNPPGTTGNTPSTGGVTQKVSGIIGKIKGFWNGPEEANPPKEKQRPRTTNMPPNTPGRSPGRYPTRQRCEGLETKSNGDLGFSEERGKLPELPTDRGFVFAVGPQQDDFEKCEDRTPPCPIEIETMPCPKQVEDCEKTTDDVWSDIDESYGYERFPFKQDKVHGNPPEIDALSLEDPYSNHKL